MTHHLLAEREVATVIAGLRHWEADENRIHTDQYDIATNAGLEIALTHIEIDELCERLNSPPLASDAQISAAKELYQRDGEVEIDQPAVESRGGDEGAYIMAWVWVSDDEVRKHNG